MGRHAFGVCVLALAVSGCGGGGGSSSAPSVSVTPTPGPSPTPTPTPTPSAAALGTGEIKLAADAVFISATLDLDITGGYSQTNGIVTGGLTSGRTATVDTPQFVGSYNAGYLLSDAVNAATFGQAQLLRDTTAPNGYGTVVFSNTNSAKADYLALYQATTYSSSTKGSGYTTAKYGGAGGWQHTVGNGDTAHTRLDYFAYGTPTPTGAMPKSGVVRYSVLKNGNYAADTDLFFLTQGSSEILTVDFAAGTISGQLGIVGQNFFKSQVGSIGGLVLKGNISGNSATGSFVDPSINQNTAVPGKFRIMFVGPNANELIITFIAIDGSQAAVGSGVGIVDLFLGGP